VVSVSSALSRTCSPFNSLSPSFSAQPSTIR